MNPQNNKFNRYFTYIRPVLKNQAVKQYSSIVFSIITITIFSVFAIKPTFSTIVSLQKSIAEQKETLNKLQTKRENLTEGQQKLLNMDKKVKDRVSTLIPNTNTVPSLINEINSLAISNQATISAFQFQPMDLDTNKTPLVKTPLVKEIAFTMNLQGSYQNLNKLLENLNNLERLVSIDSITVNKQADGNLVMAVNARAYYLKN